MRCSKNLHSIVSSFDYFVSAQQESALAVRLTSTERRPSVRGLAASRCSTPESARFWLSVTRPARPWQSWHWNTSAARRGSGERRRI